MQSGLQLLAAFADDAGIQPESHKEYPMHFWQNYRQCLLEAFAHLGEGLAM